MMTTARKIAGSTVVQATIFVTGLMETLHYSLAAGGLPPMSPEMTSAVTALLFLLAKPILTRLLD